jgi:transcriptional regulator with XRE-family HTH domain
MSLSSQSWPNVLQGIIKSPNERQRLSTALGVTPMTLSRWASGESNPQRPHLIHLVQVLQPHHRQELLDALEAQYPDIHSWLREDSSEFIPPAFFAQVLHVRTTTTEPLLFWRISELVLKQALVQLDTNHLGMAVKLIQCMPPGPDGKIHSLRERTGKGSYPWVADLEHDIYFLGLESMSGYAAEMRRVVKSDDLSKSTTFPAVVSDFEVSAAAHPIRLEGRIAGCLLASSTQVAYFSQQQLALLVAFSDIISLAFDKNDFYPANLIQLRVMPRPERQRPILATFRQRVTEKFQESMLRHEPINNYDAERQVWQEIEQELLSLVD